MKHFGIYTSSAELELAYQNKDIVNPYVALVGGNLDFNSITPCHLGEWSDDGEGHYTFQVLNSADTAWEYGVFIGQLVGVYYNGHQTNMNVVLQTNHAELIWTMHFEADDPSASPMYEFYEGASDNWDCADVMTDGDSSTASVHVDYNGTDTFVLYQGSDDAPDLYMDTINPECTE